MKEGLDQTGDGMALNSYSHDTMNIVPLKVQNQVHNTASQQNIVPAKSMNSQVEQTHISSRDKVAIKKLVNQDSSDCPITVKHKGSHNIQEDSSDFPGKSVNES